ncbi:hypothetical protein PC123_g16052 [Phytophthora cactorum]|nr:hypothetical protein PC123_g16052 [Phytophthora cactorum]
MGSVVHHVVGSAAMLVRQSQAGLSLKANGVRPKTSLVNSVAKFPVPAEVKAVKRFVHLTCYYRQFVPEFESRAAPLTKLLRKGAEWHWGEDQHTAFEDMKSKLAKRPILAYPAFTLADDVSQTGLAASLILIRARASNHGIR